jgi:hypothetical protein
LIEKRRRAALDLLSRLYDEDDRHCWEGHASNFRSVNEVIRLRVKPCFDPVSGREMLEEIKSLWVIEPLSELLRVCESSMASAA